VAGIPGLQDVSSDLQIKTPRVNIILDRDRAAALNLNWINVSNTLYDAFGPRLASTIYSPTNQYRVLLELDPQYQRHETAETDLSESDTGQMVPLDAVAQLKTDAGRRPFRIRPVALRDDFLRAQAGRFARPGTDAILEAAKQNLPPRLLARSKARPRSSRIRCGIWASC